ncbi:MAG: hypothetical protein GY793_05635 [Proteobacteria bacterium]|nr:hypothetical protein [Pseudomonadota bacterium]
MLKKSLSTILKRFFNKLFKNNNVNLATEQQAEQTSTAETKIKPAVDKTHKEEIPDDLEFIHHESGNITPRWRNWEKQPEVIRILNLASKIKLKRTIKTTNTNKFGQKIVLKQYSTPHKKGIARNLRDFIDQPRMKELINQMLPLLDQPDGESISLDEETGNFYLQSEFNEKGANKASPLGQVDLPLEKTLFNQAEKSTFWNRLSRNASF